jgi:hypothetical protein
MTLQHSNYDLFVFQLGGPYHPVKKKNWKSFLFDFPLDPIVNLSFAYILSWSLDLQTLIQK